MVGTSRRTELRREEHLATARLHCRAEELLGLAASVHARGVEEVDAGVDRRVDDLARAVLVEPHAEVVAPEPRHRDVEVGRADSAEFHQGTCHWSSMCWPKVN